jgi:hypothetical protein
MGCPKVINESNVETSKDFSKILVNVESIATLNVGTST